MRGLPPSLPPVLVHCFTGDADALAAYLERGFFISLSAWMTAKGRGAALRGLTATIPTDRLMVETDAPYLMPRGIKALKKISRMLVLVVRARFVVLFFF